jgi:hypothetical protein
LMGVPVRALGVEGGELNPQTRRPHTLLGKSNYPY